jgi:hypothetical protein
MTDLCDTKKLVVTVRLGLRLYAAKSRIQGYGGPVRQQGCAG